MAVQMDRTTRAASKAISRSAPVAGFLKTDEVQPGNATLLAEPIRPATCIRDCREAFDHLVQTRCIAGCKNDGLKRMLGSACESHPVGKDFLHRGQHTDFALLDNGDGADIRYG